MDLRYGEQGVAVPPTPRPTEASGQNAESGSLGDWRPATAAVLGSATGL